MVARACRCSTCRARKIRCDQSWPECGQCRRGKRKCPGPPASIKFVSNKTLHPSHKTDSYTAKDISLSSTVDLTGESMFFASAEIGSNIPITRPVSATPASQIAAALVHAIATEMRFNPTYLGTCVKYLPPMIDSSPALAYTVACCLDACEKNNLAVGSNRRRLDPALYGKALAEIHAALDDLERNRLDSTFYAVVLLQRIETVLVNRKVGLIPCWSVHAGGLSELLKFRGITSPCDQVNFDTIIENFGPIVSHSVMRQEDCFMTSSQWQSMLRLQRPRSSVAERMLLKMLSRLAFLPRLALLLKAWRLGEDCFSGTMELVAEISETLHTVGLQLEEEILPELSTRALDDPSVGAPVRSVYVDVPRQVARVICWHAMIGMSTNNMLMELSEYVQEEGWVPSALKSQNSVLSRRVWMLSEEARVAGVIRYYFYPGPLAISWGSAVQRETRQWIVDLMNEVQSGRMADMWTHETIKSACDALSARS